MTASWMAYVTVVSALAAGAGLGMERALRLYRRPGRWAWIGALGASAALPGLAWLAPLLGAVDPAGRGFVLSLPALVVGAAGPLARLVQDPVDPGWAARLDGALLLFWGATIAIALGLLLRSAVRLGRERRAWTPATVDGQEVLLAEERGPAVVGLLGGTIVLPRWVAEAEIDLRRAVLLHEREHLRARDHRLYALGAIVLLLAPWNPFLWWQLRRLRMAQECDCDARVLSRGVPAAAYGRSLLRVGARLSRLPRRVAAFAEPKTFLERRIEAMTEKRPRLRGPRAAASTLAALCMLALACESVPPTEPGATVSEARAVEVAEAGGDPDARPTFIPYDRPPRLRNAAEVSEALKARYPSELEEGGVGGTVQLWMHVDETGSVEETRVKETSGHPELDDAAREVAASMEFLPAANRDEPTAVWVAQAITFEPSESAPRALARYQSLPAGERPLVVLDGEIRSLSAADVRTLDPGDIERVEIIKGQAALGLYGEEARNGAIVITTKQRQRNRR